MNVHSRRPERPAAFFCAPRKFALLPRTTVHLNSSVADAFVIFRQRLPFSVRLNGRTWEVSYATGAKSGYTTIYALCRSPHKLYTLWAGRDAEISSALERGIPVASGTPERGLVTAMRRAGVVIVLPERLSKLPDRYA